MENYAYVTFKVSVLLLIILNLLVLTVLCKPRVFQYLINGETASRVLNKASCYKILCFFTNQLPAWQVKHELVLQCHTDCFLGRLVIEGK